MEEKEFKWRTANEIPKENVELVLAIADNENDDWLYIIGSYYKKGYEFKLGDGSIDKVKEDGFFMYSSRYDRLLPMINTYYWTYIQEPANNKETLIIYKEY